MKTSTNEQLIMGKIKNFQIEVLAAAKSLNIIHVPNIKFWPNHDKNHFDNARAHIHLDLNLICISEEELGRMSNEEIKETAFHEVTHIRGKNHDSSFYNLKDEHVIASWEPPSGTIKISNNLKNKIKLKEDKRKNKCFYPSCENITLKLFKCKYCKKYYCNLHNKPRKPTNKLNYPQTHPCLAYTIKIEEK